MPQQSQDQHTANAPAPEHATAEALAAYALDPRHTDDEPAKRHIETCMECRAEAAWLRVRLAALEAGPERAQCPSVETVTAYALGELSGNEQLIAAAHIRGCAACTEDVAVAREALALPADEAPESSLRAALRRVTAALAPPPALAGARAVRGADEGDTLRTYEAAGVEVTLRSAPHDTERGHFLVFGTVKMAAGQEGGRPIAPVAALLVAQGEAAAPVVIEAPFVGDAFELEPVPPGTFRLDILLADRIVEIAPITV
jgi:hypothetical protein